MSKHRNPVDEVDPRECALDMSAAKECMREAGLIGDAQLESLVSRHMAKHRVNVLELERRIAKKGGSK